MASVIEWGDLPSSARGSTRRGPVWDQVAEELKSRPGEWAKIRSQTTDPSICNRINKGFTTAFQPAGSFEATTRAVKSDDGKRRVDIWARYVGGAK
jgi:hypothetical protein